MKSTLLSLIFTFLLSSAFAQNLKDGRVVYINIGALMDGQIIQTLDSRKLSSSSQKKHMVWVKDLNDNFKYNLISHLDSMFTANQVNIQPKETIAAVSSMSDKYPTVLFPKKLIKKKASKADIGEYYVSANISFTRKALINPLKPWSVELNLTLKVFDNTGTVVKKTSKTLQSEAKLGGLDKPADEAAFDKLTYTSLGWLSDHLDADLKKVIEEATLEIL